MNDGGSDPKWFNIILLQMKQGQNKK